MYMYSRTYLKQLQEEVLTIYHEQVLVQLVELGSRVDLEQDAEVLHHELEVCLVATTIHPQVVLQGGVGGLLSSYAHTHTIPSTRCRRASW